MRELVNLTGMVLKASPVGDNDRRLVLLTRERGKITAFARGAKRPGSQLMGVTRPFVFGNFRLYEGRDACNLQGADVLNYFAEITLDMEATCYGSYFLELADYYGRENLEAAESIGCSKMRMIMKYVLPNSLAPLIVEATMGVANTVLTAASLSYIGLGVQPPTPEWGAMLSGAKGYIRDYSYMLTFPGLFIALTVLCLNMLGDGLRDALDPRLKN